MAEEFVACWHARFEANPALSLPPREFEFTDAEVARIKSAVQAWDSYGVAADRRWLQPLITDLFEVDPGVKH